MAVAWNHGRGVCVFDVMRDESGHIKFPSSYVNHVTLLALAHARFSSCSGFVQSSSPLLTPIAIFGKLPHSLLNRFNSSRGGLKIGPISHASIKLYNSPSNEDVTSSSSVPLSRPC